MVAVLVPAPMLPLAVSRLPVPALRRTSMVVLPVTFAAAPLS
jgi:hypothetical protein